MTLKFDKDSMTGYLGTLCAMLMIMLPSSAYGKRLNTERWYQNEWCLWEKEVVLEDKTRVDCLTEKYAIEFDFANKWAEAIGQSLHYSRLTGKIPAIVLIIEKESDKKYIKIMIDNINHYELGIEVFLFGPGTREKHTTPMEKRK